MSFVQNYLHVVWGTKNRFPFLVKSINNSVLNHILENAKQKGIIIWEMNGHVDHVHGLINLKSEQNLAKVVQLLKGESAYWINKNRLTPHRFEWADEYYGVSVSPSSIESVIRYIRNQEKHHRKKSFAEEVELFLNAYDKVKQN